MRTSRFLRPTVLACALGASSCDVSGLVDLGGALLNPQAALLDVPGRQLISGRFFNLVVDGSIETGGTVIAFRADTEEPTVAVVPFNDGAVCEISPAVAFDRLSSRIDIALPGLIAVHSSQEEGRGKLGFYGFDCRERLPTLSDAELPRLLFPALSPWGVLTLAHPEVTGEEPESSGTDGAPPLRTPDDLYLVDVVLGSQGLVAEGVLGVSVTPDRLWTNELGTLVVRNDSLLETQRFGKAVVDFRATGGEQLPVVYWENETQDLSYWNRLLGPVQVGPDTCGHQLLGPDAVAYYDDCSGGTYRLNILVGASRVLRDPRLQDEHPVLHFLGPPGIRIPDLQVRWGEGVGPTEILMLQNMDPPHLGGRLLVSYLPTEMSIDDGEPIDLETRELGQKIVMQAGRFYKDFEPGPPFRGTLLQPQRAEDEHIIGLKTLAKEVAQIPGISPFSNRGILADFDGTQGRLVRLSETPEGDIVKTTVARNVPIQQHQVDANEELIAFVADLVDGAGTLAIADDQDVYVIAKNVLVNTVRFLDDPFGLIYLRKNGKQGSAALHVHLIDPGIDLPIHEAVSEYRAIPWPSPGVLYSVAEGEEQGLWFAKAR